MLFLSVGFATAPIQAVAQERPFVKYKSATFQLRRSLPSQRLLVLELRQAKIILDFDSLKPYRSDVIENIPKVAERQKRETDSVRNAILVMFATRDTVVAAREFDARQVRELFRRFMIDKAIEEGNCAILDAGGKRHFTVRRQKGYIRFPEIEKVSFDFTSTEITVGKRYFVAGIKESVYGVIDMSAMVDGPVEHYKSTTLRLKKNFSARKIVVTDLPGARIYLNYDQCMSGLEEQLRAWGDPPLLSGGRPQLLLRIRDTLAAGAALRDTVYLPSPQPAGDRLPDAVLLPIDEAIESGDCAIVDDAGQRHYMVIREAGHTEFTPSYRGSLPPHRNMQSGRRYYLKGKKKIFECVDIQT